MSGMPMGPMEAGPRSAADVAAFHVPPARVHSAFDFLGYCDHVECHPGPGDSLEARDLTKTEAAAKEAALRVIQQYLDGEMDFGDRPIIVRQERRDDGPGDRPAPVTPTPRTL